MKISRLRWSAVAAGAGLFAVILAGCVVPVGGGYEEGGVGVGLGVDYYEPYGAIYGGWGPGFRVAPFRGGGERRENFNRSDGGQHSFRSAPASHAMPSIPSRGHSGGGGGGRRH
jgi:hypothetical protein